MTSLKLPQVVVEVNGRPLSGAEAASLGEIRVGQKLSLPAQCEISFFNQPSAAVTAAFMPGAQLQVSVRDQTVALFEGDVTALEYTYEPAQGRQVRVRGYDRLHRLRKRQPVRSHVQVSLADLARELASGLGLRIEGPPVDLTWRRLIQHGQTDLELLSEVAGSCGVYFTLRGDVLHLLTLEGVGQPVPLSLGESLMEARIEINGDPACRTVAIDAWDPARVEPHEGRARQARVGRLVAAEVPSEKVVGEPERRLVHQAAQDARVAEALAQAELDLRVAREVVLRGVAAGDSQLRPGARIAVKGVAAAVAGRYVLTEVTHILDNQQRFVSEISTCPALPEARVRGSSVVLGKVTSVDDPEGLGRVQVSLPACHGVETDWMSVLSAGAGRNKGLIMLPDVGDHVLVLCVQEDPSQGVVLGGLYGTGGPPDHGVQDRSVQRYTCQTRAGHRLRFDDVKQTVRLENGKGSYLELGPDKVVVHAEADLEIEAPGKTINIRAGAINFEEG